MDRRRIGTIVRSGSWEYDASVVRRRIRTNSSQEIVTADASAWLISRHDNRQSRGRCQAGLKVRRSHPRLVGQFIALSLRARVATYTPISLGAYVATQLR